MKSTYLNGLAVLNAGGPEVFDGGEGDWDWARNGRHNRTARRTYLIAFMVLLPCLRGLVQVAFDPAVADRDRSLELTF